MELFTTYNRAGEPQGLVERAEVHRQGLWHKSAQVFVFDAAGQLLIQRRALAKDLYPDRWDYSVGEHLVPNESYLSGARRGLQEELGISGVRLEQLGAERWVEIAGPNHMDREIRTTFCCTYGGKIVPDSVEVSDVKYVSTDDLQTWMSAQPDDFTPWFVEELKVTDLRKVQSKS